MVKLPGVDRLLDFFNPLASVPASARADFLSPLFLPLKTINSSLENHRENAEGSYSNFFIPNSTDQWDRYACSRKIYVWAVLTAEASYYHGLQSAECRFRCPKKSPISKVCDLERKRDITACLYQVRKFVQQRVKHLR